MDPNRPQPTARQPQTPPQQPHPAAFPAARLYQNSVVSLTGERMRQLAEHFTS